MKGFLNTTTDGLLDAPLTTIRMYFIERDLDPQSGKNKKLN